MSLREEEADHTQSMQIVRLTPFHAAEYRALMLHAYAIEDDAFTSTVAERESLSLEWWMQRVSDEHDPSQLVFGAFIDDQLIGVAGLRFERRPRTRHKATLFGMFVRPQFRDRGVGRALVNAVLEFARSKPGTEVIVLSVTQSNVDAVHLYTSCGFLRFGIEPLANKVNGRFVSLLHMWRHVDTAETARWNSPDRTDDFPGSTNPESSSSQT